MVSKHTVVGVSDVSVGYGSPEVPALMDSVCRMLGCTGLLIEPDEISRPPLAFTWKPAFDLKRITSRHPDHSPAWHREYLSNAMREVERARPQVLIVFGSSVFSALLALKRWPSKVVYHAYEFISNLTEHDINAHRLLFDKMDLVIAPDIERLILDTERFQILPKRVGTIYNVADVAYPHPVMTLKPNERNGRFLWFGTLHRHQAFADHFLIDEVRSYQFDLFGRITDPNAADVARRMREAPNLRYFGVLSPEEVNRRRAENIFSFVWWNPEISPGHYYVPSNRFFTSVQAHVPPICAPHPQSVQLIKRYGCGILMDDWSPASFARAVKRAWRIYESDRYATIIGFCEDAVREEFTWEQQFARIEPHLKGALAQRPEPAEGEV